MSKLSNLREPATIQEEISDLHEYLEGLPREILHSGAFISYEKRMEELKRELIQSTIINRRLAASKKEHKSLDDTLKLTAQIVISHSSISELTLKELVDEIKEIYILLSSLEVGIEAPEDALIKRDKEAEVVKKPLVPLNEIVKRKYVVCLECGKKMPSLIAHLRKAHNLTPKEYFRRYGLDPKKYPLVCKNYSARHRKLAKEKGKGTPLRRKVYA